jgi:hypothetical protein
LSFKKPPEASEQARSDMVQARHAWRQAQAAMNSGQRVFLDETGASTGMTPTRGRSPRSQRCLAAAPRGHWETTTFIAA